MKKQDNILTEKQLSLLGSNPIFQNVPPETLRKLLNKEITLRSFQKGEIIYSPDHFEESLGFFLKGSAAAEKSGGSVVLNTFQPGSCFGVATLFCPSKRYVTTVRAQTDCQLAFLSGDSMTRLFAKEPRISLNYIAFLSSRVHFLNRKIDQFTAVSAEEKLVLWLLEQAEMANPISLKGSYGKLAESLDLGRSSLYRAMDALEADGILKKEKKLLTILDMDALERWSPKNN